MKWFTALFPVILAGVIHVQQALPTAPGATKKATLLAAIKAGAEVGEAIPEEHVEGVSAVIDAVVSALKETNFAGFGKSKVAVIPPAPVAAIPAEVHAELGAIEKQLAVAAAVNDGDPHLQNLTAQLGIVRAKLAPAPVIPAAVPDLVGAFAT